MGTWGASLYDDDAAKDFKDTLNLVCKIPADGNHLLRILEKTYGNCDPMSDEGVIFWLVTADQFERRGIECAKVTATAIGIIENGFDLSNALEKGADSAFIRKRTTILQQLVQRLKFPRPIRKRPSLKNVPDLVFNTGEVYSFPTMKKLPWSPYRLETEAPFVPDGWGAMVVLSTGRAFNWLPWVAIASLTVEPSREPTLDNALQARLLTHPQTKGAARIIPKRIHTRQVGLNLLGRVSLNPELVEPQLSQMSIQWALYCNWNIFGGIFAPNSGVPVSCELASLLDLTNE